MSANGYEPAPCLLPDCDGYGHPEDCTRQLGELKVAGQLEFTIELVANESGRHVSVLGTTPHMDEAMIERCRTRKGLLQLAAEFQDVAALLAKAVDELPDQDECHDCEQLWPVDELVPDGNGDPICPDCAITGAGVLESDAAAYRSYAYSGR